MIVVIQAEEIENVIQTEVKIKCDVQNFKKNICKREVRGNINMVRAVLTVH